MNILKNITNRTHINKSRVNFLKLQLIFIKRKYNNYRNKNANNKNYKVIYV